MGQSLAGEIERAKPSGATMNWEVRMRQTTRLAITLLTGVAIGIGAVGALRAQAVLPV
jgi:hypothetical protein